MAETHATVYVAGPLGFSAPGARYHAEVVLPALRAAGFEPLDPWAVPAAIAAVLALPEGDPVRVEQLPGVNEAIGRRNAELIARADHVLAVLDGMELDSGTAAEIGYAAGLGTRVVGLRTDFRRAGDNEAALVNLQVEWFIRASGGAIERDLDAAIARLRGE